MVDTNSTTLRVIAIIAEGHASQALDAKLETHLYIPLRNIAALRRVDVSEHLVVLKIEETANPAESRSADILRKARGALSNYEVSLAIMLDPPKTPRTFVFDMDSTLVDCEAIDELARAHGVVEEVSAVTAAAMRGELDFEASLRTRVSKLEGLEYKKAEHVTSCIVDEKLMLGATELLERLHRDGATTAVVSGGFHLAVDKAQARLGLHHAHANRLEVQDGVLTGGLVGPIVTPEYKREVVRSLVSELGDNTCLWAIGDGSNDRLMLEETQSRGGVGVAFHAKKVLRDAATAAFDTGPLTQLGALLDSLKY